MAVGESNGTVFYGHILYLNVEGVTFVVDEGKCHAIGVTPWGVGVKNIKMEPK